MKVSQAISCTPNKLALSTRKENGSRIPTFVRLVHELKQFVNDRLQEFPMGLEEARVLPNDIHDVGGDNSLVILTTFYFTKTQEIFDNSDQKTLFRFLI